MSRLLALSLCFLLSTSCSTISFGRFYEEKSANVILQFYGWNAIYMTRPDTRQADFLPVLSRDQVERELRQRVLPRDLVVVIIGNTYSSSQLAQIVGEWKKLLGAQGFHRVVLLRAGPGNQIDGLPIIEDSANSSATDQPGRTAGIAGLAPVLQTGSAREV